MFSLSMALCGLLVLLSNCDIHIPTPSDSTVNGSDDVTRYYVSYDVSYDVRFTPPTRTGRIRWKSVDAKGHGRGGYLRMRSKYRSGYQGDSSDDYSNEYWIKRTILNQYDRSTLPARSDATTIPLYVGMSLYHILDTVIN